MGAHSCRIETVKAISILAYGDASVLEYTIEHVLFVNKRCCESDSLLITEQ